MRSLQIHPLISVITILTQRNPVCVVLAVRRTITPPSRFRARHHPGMRWHNVPIDRGSRHSASCPPERPRFSGFLVAEGAVPGAPGGGEVNMKACVLNAKSTTDASRDSGPSRHKASKWRVLQNSGATGSATFPRLPPLGTRDGRGPLPNWLSRGCLLAH